MHTNATCLRREGEHEVRPPRQGGLRESEALLREVFLPFLELGSSAAERTDAEVNPKLNAVDDAPVRHCPVKDLDHLEEGAHSMDVASQAVHVF